jgi:hypothetical protein
VTFKDRLAQIAPRDVSGSRSSDRFVYQQTWALCRLLLLHQGDDDYVMTFDHHEDVTILDSEVDPTSISGFQVKTADSNWTINSLLKRKAGKGEQQSPLSSILGKLYDLKIKFPSEVDLLAFVSNTSVNVRLKPTGKKVTDQKQTKFDALDERDQKQIANALKVETNLQSDPILSEVLEFVRSDLPLEGHDTYGRGRLAEFLNALFPNKKFQVHVLFGALLSEVAARNNNQDPIETFADIIKHKSLSRGRFSEILDQAGVSHKSVDWSEVSHRLNIENVPLPYIQGVRQQWDLVTIDRLARRDLPFTSLWQAVEAECNKYESVSALYQTTEAIFAKVIPTLRREWGFLPSYVRTCIIVKIYELGQSEAAGTGVEEEGSK